MTDLLRPNTGIDALAVAVTRRPVPAEQVISGSPSAGLCELLDGVVGRPGIGIWEHSPGESIDVESDEVFIVLSGCASVEFTETGDKLMLTPGVVARFAEGTTTRWTVTETLRKLYIA